MLRLDLERPSIVAAAFALGIVLTAGSAHAGVFPARSADAGPPVNGVALAVTAEPSTISLGGSITLLVEIRNGSNQEIHIDFPQYGTSYDFVAIDEATGTPVPLQPHPRISGQDIYSFMGANVPVDPGQSWLQSIVISDYFDFGRAGTYDVRVAFSRFVVPRRHRPFTVTSNTAVIHIVS